MSDTTTPAAEAAPEYDIPEVASAGWAERFFILQPVVGLLLTVLIVAAGCMAYQGLVKESLPDLAIPQATVSTWWPGADPQTIEQEVTEELERELSGLRGLKRLRSASFGSYSLIAVEFVAEADLTDSMQRLRAKISDAEAQLPTGVETPTVTQVSVDDMPILSFALVGDVNTAILSRTAEDLEDRLERVPGINEVKIAGLRQEIVRIQLAPTRLAALGLSPTRVRDRIQQANLDMPWGEIESDELGATTRLYGRFRSVEDLRDLPVARLDAGSGRVVRLGEVAEVRRDLEQESTRAALSHDGKPFRPAIEMSLTKVPAADTLQAIAAAKAELAAAVAGDDWPAALDTYILNDQSEQIWESLLRVFNNGWQAMIGVFLVLLVMLTWREALIAGLSIPLTFLGALAVLWLIGYTLNEMVLIGMVLALGLLVDVFILMMEGMHEGIYVARLSFPQAALWTVRRFALPAFAGQMTTILALSPLIAVSGTSGKFIRILPITTISCLVMSFVVALAIDVPLSRYILPRKGSDRKTLADRVTLRLSAWLAALTARTTARNRWLAAAAVALSFALFGVAAFAFSRLPTQLYEQRDGRTLGVTVELAAGTTLDASQRCADLVGDLLQGEDYLKSVVKLTGKKSPLVQGSLGEALAPSQADYLVGFSCRFVPPERRDRAAFEYLDDLRAEVGAAVDRRFPGAQVQLSADTGQPTSADPVQIEVVGADMDVLRRLSKQVQNGLREIPGAVDVRDNLGNVQVDVRLKPKREALDFHGIGYADLAAQVRFAMGDQEIGQFAVGGTAEDLDIRMGTAWPSRGGDLGGPTRMEELVAVRAFKPDGTTVPVMAVVEPIVGTAPISITRQDGRRAIAVSSKVQGDRLPSQILADFTPVLDRMQDQWPSGYEYRFGGEAEEAAEAFGSAGSALVVAMFLVFALLVLLFGSFAQPFIIVCTIPLALIGTFLGFWTLGMSFSFLAMIGVISLIGIVVNDAIVMVETMNDHLRRGHDVRTAATQGSADRLRPVLCTSITTIIGLVPLALSDPMWQPLCAAIIFGLVASTVLSLLVIPSLYLLLTRERP